MRKNHLTQMRPAVKFMHDFGTPGILNPCVESDDAPCKNWAGVTTIDFPQYRTWGQATIDRAGKALGLLALSHRLWRPYGGRYREYKYEEGAHKPEYESLAMFGTDRLNDHLESIIEVNDIATVRGRYDFWPGANRFHHRML